jgi:hypothetical protein
MDGSKQQNNNVIKKTYRNLNLRKSNSASGKSMKTNKKQLKNYMVNQSISVIYESYNNHTN